jgi:hypothetical protein
MGRAIYTPLGGHQRGEAMKTPNTASDTEFTPLRAVKNRLAGRRQDRPSDEHAKPLRFQSSLLKDQPDGHKGVFYVNDSSC